MPNSIILNSKHLPVRHASSMAVEHKKQLKARSAKDFCKYSRDMIEFQIMALQSELELLKELSNMTDEERIETLFDILKDGKTSTTVETIPSSTVRKGLQTIRGAGKFEESLIVAADNVQDGIELTEVEFDTLLRKIVTVIDCSIQHLVEMLVVHVVFVDTEVIHAVAVQHADDQEEKPKEVDVDLRSAMRDRRMKALFKVFDTNESATVDFKQIVIGLYKVLDDHMDSPKGVAGSPGNLELEASHAAVNALLLFDDNESRELSYREFARLMLNIVASLPGGNLTFDDLADGLTRNASASEEIPEIYALQKWSMDTTSKLLLTIADDDEFTDLGVVEWSKMERLFHIWDTNNDNLIGMKELALSLRKFHISTGMKTTIEEVQQVMSTFDKTKQGSLNLEEFSRFIISFSKAAGIKLLDMLDFMIVVTAVHANTEAELEYMKDLEKLNVDFSYG